MSAATSDDDRSGDDHRRVDAPAAPDPVPDGGASVAPPSVPAPSAADPTLPPPPDAAGPVGAGRGTADPVPPRPAPDGSAPAGADATGPVPVAGDAVPLGAGVVAPPPRRRGRVLLGALATAVAVAALGAPLGWLWAVVAPSVPVVKTEDGGVLTESQPEQFVAADGWFTVLGLAFGVLAAVLVWVLLRRYRGPVGLVAVVVGALGASLIAWGLGRQIGLAEFRRLLRSAPMGEVLSRPPDLRAGRFEWVHGFIPTIQGDLLLPAFGAAVAYTLLAGWSRYASLNAEPANPGPGPAGAPPVGSPPIGTAPVSWDSPAPPAPPTAPAPPAPGAATPPPD